MSALVAGVGFRNAQVEIASRRHSTSGHTDRVVSVHPSSGTSIMSRFATAPQTTVQRTTPNRAWLGLALNVVRKADMAPQQQNLLTLTGEPMAADALVAWEDGPFRASMERSLQDFYAGRLVNDEALFDVDLDDELE